MRFPGMPAGGPLLQLALVGVNLAPPNGKTPPGFVCKCFKFKHLRQLTTLRFTVGSAEFLVSYEDFA
jgi:hypothetical protein